MVALSPMRCSTLAFRWPERGASCPALPQWLARRAKVEVSRADTESRSGLVVFFAAPNLRVEYFLPCSLSGFAASAFGFGSICARSSDAFEQGGGGFVVAAGGGGEGVFGGDEFASEGFY